MIGDAEYFDDESTPSFEDQLPKEHDLIRKKEIHQSVNTSFVDEFILKLAREDDITSLKKLLNFREDSRGEVRFLIAKRLRELLHSEDSEQSLLAKSVLKEFTNDNEAVIRLFAIDTLRQFS